MKELARIYKELGQDFVNDLFKDYLVVTEKLSGSAFSFEKAGSSLKFFKSNDKPINLVDRTLMVYYEKPINYIKDSTDSFMDSIPGNWRFCFQYFVHNEPGVIRYDKLPKNNLVLTHILVKNPNGKVTKIIEDPRVIEDWSNALGVTPLLPIFKGYLTDEQKESIKKFIKTPIEDQLEIFKTSSFAEYLIKVLNPKLSSTILQDDLSKPVESIIFKFYKTGGTQIISAKLIDPYTANLLKHREPIDPKKAPADVNEILLLDILAFIEERGLRSNELLTTSPDERYLELVSSIFNDYIVRRGKGIADLGIERADFAKGDEFKLNVDLIPSQVTQATLKQNEKMQDLFKIMLGSLRKKRNPDKPGNVLTPSVIEDFNALVSKIEDAINKPVDDKFKTFSDYLNLKKTNESYQTAEDLILEEKVLSYNNFINLGKVIIEADVMDQKIKNPETGRSIKVSSAVNYDKDTAVYKKAKELLGSDEKTSQSTMSDSLKKKFTPERVKNIQSDYSRIAFESDKDKEDFTKGFDNLLNGNSLSPDEAKVVSKYAKVGDAKNALKIYFASSKPGVFGQTSREKVLDLTDKDGSLKDEMTKLGMEITASTTVEGGEKPKIGTKEINPNKLAENKTYKPKVDVTKNSEGEIQEISIGSTKLKRLKEPDQEKLFSAYKKQNPNLTDDEVKGLVDRTNRAIERNNKSLEKFEKLKDIELLEPVPGTQDLSQKERAEKIGKEYPKLISEKMKNLIGDNPTEKEKEVLKGIEDLSDINDPEDFNQASVEVLRKMDDIEALRKGSSDLAESFAYIYMNKKGFRTELPAGENFPVADVICLGSDLDVDNLDPNAEDYAEKIAMQGLGLAVNLETIGGISVKKDGGAASALKNKIGESSFKNKETSVKLDQLADNHNSFLGTVESQTTPETIKKGNQLLDETEDWAVKSGIIDKDKLPLKYGNRTSDEWAADTLKKWEDDGYGPFCDFQKDALAGHLRASLLVAEIHNNDLEEQSYGNINVSTAKQGGGMNVTDGITTASLMKPSPNPGFKFIKGKGKDGCTIPRPNAIYSANLVHADYDPTTERFKMNK
jgi:hypothetical protein